MCDYLSFFSGICDKVFGPKVDNSETYYNICNCCSNTNATSKKVSPVQQTQVNNESKHQNKNKHQPITDQPQSSDKLLPNDNCDNEEPKNCKYCGKDLSKYQRIGLHYVSCIRKTYSELPRLKCSKCKTYWMPDIDDGRMMLDKHEMRCRKS